MNAETLILIFNGGLLALVVLQLGRIALALENKAKEHE